MLISVLECSIAGQVLYTDTYTSYLFSIQLSMQGQPGRRWGVKDLAQGPSGDDLPIIGTAS